jgi:hypothetical protein
MPYLFVEFRTGDYEVPTVSWVIDAPSPEAIIEIEKTLERLDSEEHDHPYVGEVHIATVEEFMNDMKNWLPEEDDDATAPAVPTGD